MNEKTLIIDGRMYAESKRTLTKMGFKLIEIPQIEGFEQPICGHPDIHVFKLNNWFISRYVNNQFTFLNHVKVDREPVHGKVFVYPDNVFLNCAVVGKNLICNIKYTLRDILSEAENAGYNIINVKQGYAKCSTCVINGNSIITEDDGIARVCTDAGIEVLKIKKGFVKLDGYEYGFIGGASGLIEKNVVAFNGNINMHPEYYKIMEFCSKRDVTVVSLCDKPLYDVGSIIRIW